MVAERGPDHFKHFEVVALLGKKVWGSGRGKSKKEAEQVAAREALKALAGENFDAEESQCQPAET